jgi:type 1 glutamine amidotransferase
VYKRTLADGRRLSIRRESAIMTFRPVAIASLVLVIGATLAAQGQGGAAAPGQRGGPPRPKRAVIVTGENSYNGHVWKETSAEIKNILDAGKDFAEVVIQADPNFIASDEFLTFDVAIFDFRNQNPLAQEEKVEANLLKFLAQPKGLVTVHWANGAFPYWPEFVNIVGRAQQSVHDPRGPFTVKIVSPNHPITREMKDYDTDDELFWDTKIGNRTITPVVVATSKVHFADFPMAFEMQYNRARVFNTTMGHDVKALKVPGTAELIRRGAAWSAGILK